MNEQEMLMRKISSLRFSMWELHLFLELPSKQLRRRPEIGGGPQKSG